MNFRSLANTLVPKPQIEGKETMKTRGRWDSSEPRLSDLLLDALAGATKIFSIGSSSSCDWATEVMEATEARIEQKKQIAATCKETAAIYERIAQVTDSDHSTTSGMSEAPGGNSGAGLN